MRAIESMPATCTAMAAIALLTACRSTLMPRPVSASTTEQEVLDVLGAWNDAFAKNDVARYFELVDPDVTVLTPANPYRVEGLAQDREEFEFSLASGKTHVNLFQMMLPRIQLL